jgi:hypothetical protein
MRVTPLRARGPLEKAKMKPAQQTLSAETLRRVIGAIYFAQIDALVDMFGDDYGAALATLANQSLMTFAKNTDDPATRDVVMFIADCADDRVKPGSQ